MSATMTVSCSLCSSSMTGTAREVINYCDRIHPKFCPAVKAGFGDPSITPDGGRRETSQ